MNGKTESEDRTLIELVVVILLESRVAPSCWSEIFKPVNYVLNRIPKSNTKTSPYEILKNKTPNLSYLRTWGCLVYVTIPYLNMGLETILNSGFTTSICQCPSITRSTLWFKVCYFNLI